MARPYFRLRRRPARKSGYPPGTLVYTGEPDPEPVRIRVYAYDDEHFDEHELDDAAACRRYRDAHTVTWIDVDGVHDVEAVRSIGHAFDIHDLTLEDVIHANQGTKVEEYDAYVLVVVHMVQYDHVSAELSTEQVSLIVGDGFVISFQEQLNGDAFEPVRTWLRDHRGRIRSSGADYLAYALIDVVVDHYMDVLEGLGEHIEDLEDEITTDHRPDVMHRIVSLRRRVMTLRRAVWPLRDVAASLERSELPFFAPETDHFFRDVYDQTVRTTEIVESAREILSSLSDLHMSALSVRMNDIMKMLAVIATFFLPLSFIAGVYGMNFDRDASPLNMPELEWYLGYPFALTLMAVVAGSMYLFFRRKGWL